MNLEKIVERIIIIIRDQVGKQINLNLNEDIPTQTGLDSLSFTEVIMDIENYYTIEIMAKDIPKLQTIKDISLFVQKKLTK